MDKIFFGIDDDVLDPCQDPTFKAIFTKDTPESKAALNGLMSGFLNREAEVFAVCVNEPPVDDIHDRQIRYDINCRFVTGELADAEMTVFPDASEVKRLEYYAAKLHTSQNLKGKGTSYKDTKETFQISFIVNGALTRDDVLVHRFEYYDAKNMISLEGCSHIITIELSKLNRVLQKAPEEMTREEAWAVFFRCSADKGRRAIINRIIECEGAIAMAAQTLLTISRDEIERARLLSEYKFEMDLQSKIVDAKRAGHAEGEAKGRAEGEKSKAVAIAKNALMMNMQVNDIAELTGFTREEIEALREAN